MITVKKGLDPESPAREIRTEVFIEEQGFQVEFDEIDEIAGHVIIDVEGEAAATGRAFPKKGTKEIFIIGRVAVLKKFRLHHLGSQVIEALETYVKLEGGREIELSAQLHAKGFYQKLGYVPEGEIYLDEHCEHILMRKKL